MPFSRKPVSKESSVPMIIVALLIGVMVGFASGWEVSSLQFRGRVAPPAPPASPSGASVNAPAPVQPVNSETLVPANPAVYRAVVDAVTKSGLTVTVKEGAPTEPQITLIAATYAALRPVQQAPQDYSGWDSSKGVPPPPKPLADPYKEQPMKLADLKVGDVVEFSTGEMLTDGATVQVVKAVWIMNVSGQQGGSIGDGTAAPTVPKK